MFERRGKWSLNTWKREICCVRSCEFKLLEGKKGETGGGSERSSGRSLHRLEVMLLGPVWARVGRGGRREWQGQGRASLLILEPSCLEVKDCRLFSFQVSLHSLLPNPKNRFWDRAVSSSISAWLSGRTHMARPLPGRILPGNSRSSGHSKTRLSLHPSPPVFLWNVM